MDPIFEALKAGHKFSFDLLASEYEATDQYWSWWWENKATYDQLARPEIIADDDPMLEKTIGKATFSEDQHSFLLANYFEDWKAYRIQRHSQTGDPRTKLHDDIVAALTSGLQAKVAPTITFGGGGYGGGKTTSLLFANRSGWQQISSNSVIGVDRCKQLIPEFSYISRISDGRASLTVQDEAVAISEILFQRALQGGYSFFWDSSMSDRDKTQEKIDACLTRGYDIQMIGVLIEREAVMRRAMKRGLEIRRFAHPIALPASHQGFMKNLEFLAPQFKECFILDNSVDAPEDKIDSHEPTLVAYWKHGHCETLDEERLDQIRKSWD